MNVRPQDGDRMATTVIGIVGGIGSGKSLVASQLESLGARLFSADEAGHQALLSEDLKEQLRDRWGDHVLTSAGELDRAVIAERVFHGDQCDAERAFLEQLVHPQIDAAMQSFLQLARSDEALRWAVLDAALLIEAGWDAQCDLVLFVEADDSVRLARCLQRGWTEQQWRDREATQMSLDEKKRRSDQLLVNHGNPQELASELRQLLQIDSQASANSDSQGLNEGPCCGDNDK